MIHTTARRRATGWLLWLLFLHGAGCAAAGDDSNQVLHGIAAAAFVIDGVEEGLGPYGLDRAALNTAMSERLQQAGITVITSEEVARRPDAVLLRLRVRLMRAPYYFYLYGVNLSVRGKLALAHNPDAYSSAEIWSEGDIGAVQPTELGTLRELSLKLIDRFLAERALQNGGS